MFGIQYFEYETLGVVNCSFWRSILCQSLKHWAAIQRNLERDV